MAKKEHESKASVIVGASPFGSHSSMIDADETKALDQKGKVVCRDQNGSYVTDEGHINSGLIDPNRLVGYDK